MLFYSCSDLAVFMIDMFNRYVLCEKKYTVIIIIFFYGVPTTRVIREISISANCRLIVSPPSATVAAVRVTLHPLQTSLRTIWFAIKHTLTLQKVLSRFLGLQRKPFQSRSIAIINIKTEILNYPSAITIYHLNICSIISQNIDVMKMYGLVDETKSCKIRYSNSISQKSLFYSKTQDNK